MQTRMLIKANRKCTCILDTVYTSTPADLPDPRFQFFEGLVLRLHCIQSILVDTRQVRVYLDSNVSKVLTVLKWWMMLKRKQLEKQRVDRLAPYEVHIRHFCFSFRKRLTLSIFRFYWTDKLAEGQNWLFNPFVHACTRYLYSALSII